MDDPTTIRSALFVDFDNVYLGLRDIDEAAAESFATDPGRWLAWLQAGLPRLENGEGGEARTPPRSVLVRRCYMNPRAFHVYRPYFIRSAFSVIDCPPLTSTGKTGTDIHMVMDVLDTLQHPTRFEEFVILSGDADFTPVLLRLRSHDRRTMVFAAGPAALAYLAACDRVISEDQFVEAILGPGGAAGAGRLPAPVTTAGASTELLEAMAVALADRARAFGDVVAIDLPALYKTFPAFVRQSDWLGFYSLRRLTQALVNRRPELRLEERVDTWLVVWQAVPADAPGPAPAAGATAAPPGPEASRDTAAARDREPARASDEIEPELAGLAGRVSRLSGTPLLSGRAYRAVFQAIAESVRKEPYHLTVTSKTVRDMCIEHGHPLARGHVSFILKGLTYAGCRLGADSSAEPDVLADTYLDNVLRRCEDAGLALDDDERRLVARWIRGVDDG